MPPALIARANDILAQLEEKNVGNGSNGKSSIGEQVKKIAAPKIQLSIFDAHSETFDQIRKLLEDMDINRLTPVEALLKLQDIKNMIK
jgi:DNA mismatch repair protein MutS